MCNCVIYMVAGILFGLDRALYSLLTYFITSKIIDKVETGLEQAKAAMIITDEGKEIADQIYQKLGRTVTMLEGEGLVRIVPGQGAFAAERKTETDEQPCEKPFDWERHISAEARDYAAFRENEGRVDLGNREVISFSSLAPDYHAFENDAFRRNLRPIQTGKSFQEEILRLRFAFSPSGRRKLTEKNPSFSLPEFRQRRVLQVKSALQQRIPIPYGRFFQRNLRDAAAVSRPPHPGIVEAVPIPFRIGGLESRNFKIRGQQSGAAAPIARNCILVI